MIESKCKYTFYVFTFSFFFVLFCFFFPVFVTRLSSLVYFKEEKDILPFSFDFCNSACARRIQIQYEIN